MFKKKKKWLKSYFKVERCNIRRSSRSSRHRKNVVHVFSPPVLVAPAAPQVSSGPSGLFIDAEILTDRIRLSDAERAPVCFSSINYEKKNTFKVTRPASCGLWTNSPSFSCSFSPSLCPLALPGHCATAWSRTPTAWWTSAWAEHGGYKLPTVLFYCLCLSLGQLGLFFPIRMGEKNKFNIWCVSRRQWSGPGWTVNELLHW